MSAAWHRSLRFEDYSSDFTNFADDTTPHKCGPTVKEVMNNLEITREKNVWLVQFQQFESKWV